MGRHILRVVDLESLLTTNIYQSTKQTCFHEVDVRDHKSRAEINIQ